MSDLRHTDLLSRDDILAELSGAARAWITVLEIHDQIDSTNSHLMRQAAHDDVEGRICLAEQQTAGRGRRGRTWLSPKGANIALSIGLRLAVPNERISSLSLVVGMAVADVVARYTTAQVGLKWPNDILLGEAKLGGILIELARMEAPATVVIGVGLNVGGAALVRDSVDRPVADLADYSDALSRSELAGALVSSIYDFCLNFEQVGFAAMREAWLDLHVYQGREVRLIVGERTVRGTVCGVTATGELELDTAEGRLTFGSGEVSLRAP